MLVKSRVKMAHRNMPLYPNCSFGDENRISEQIYFKLERLQLPSSDLDQDGHYDLPSPTDGYIRMHSIDAQVNQTECSAMRHCSQGCID